MSLTLTSNHHLSIHTSAHPPIYASMHPPMHPSTHPSTHPPTDPSSHPSIHTLNYSWIHPMICWTRLWCMFRSGNNPKFLSGGTEHPVQRERKLLLVTWMHYLGNQQIVKGYQVQLTSRIDETEFSVVVQIKIVTKFFKEVQVMWPSSWWGADGSTTLTYECV